MVRDNIYKYKEIDYGNKKIYIPSDWKVKNLESIIKTHKPICYGVLKPGEYHEGGVPLIKINNLIDNNLDENKANYHLINDKLNNQFSRSKIVGGEILYSIQGTIGKIGIVPSSFEGANISRTIARISINNLNSTLYIKYFLLSKRARDIISIVSSGSTRASYNIGDLRKLKVVLPPLPEQNKIATILSSVDNAIKKTDEIINKAKKLKKGLMQDLLTKGIGHSEFRKVVINGVTEKIPLSWKVKTLNDICNINKDSISSKTKDDFIIEYIDISSINKIGLIENTKEYKFEDAPSRARRLVSKGDIIVSTVRPYLKSFSLINETKDNLVCSTGFAVLNPKSGIYSHYVYSYVWSNQFVNYMKRLMIGTSYPAVNISDVKNTELPVPPLDEQKKIANILSLVDNKIQKEKENKEKLEKLKKGLMQKLLTGEIRVKIDTGA